MAWGIMMTVVMLLGMLGLAMFEVRAVAELPQKPDVDRNTDRKKLNKAA